MTLHCPLCGVATDVVRQIMGNMYELACQACDSEHVVFLDDHQALPGSKQ